MITGAAAASGMVVAAGVIIARYLRLENAASVLGGAASLAAPILLASALVLVLGRRIYGDWSDRSPVIHALAFFIRSAGMFVATALGAMLLFILLTGVKPGDATAAFVLGAGTVAGIGLSALGMRIRSRSGRSYLD